MTAFPEVPEPLLTIPSTPSVLDTPAFAAHAGLPPLYTARKFSNVPAEESLHNSKFCRPCVNVSNDVAAYTVCGASVGVPRLIELFANGFSVLVESIAHRTLDPIQNPNP